MSSLDHCSQLAPTILFFFPNIFNFFSWWPFLKMFLSSLCLCVQIYCSLCKYTCRLLSVCIRRAAYTHVCVRQWASQVRSCFCQKLSALPLVRRLLCHWCTRPFWLNRFGSAVRAVINGKKRTVPCECVRLLVCNDLPWTRSAEPDRCHDALIHRRETLKNHYCISKRECWDRWRMFDLFFFSRKMRGNGPRKCSEVVSIGTLQIIHT